ncbi:MAG: glycosyltransferase family 2 protein [Actinomycetota bacterium]|nr:glycosyltransferase family 2 protein [Actinomycetota bacterium]
MNPEAKESLTQKETETGTVAVPATPANGRVRAGSVADWPAVRAPRAEVAAPSHHVRTDGKFFATGSTRFDFRGVTYGTFAPRDDGAQFPDQVTIRRDMEMMRDAGFTVVRTYTLPPGDLLEAAGECGLRVLADVFYPDWRYLLGMSRRESRRVEREARAEVRKAARALAGDERVLGLSLGNEVPADVLRWQGVKMVAHTLRDLAAVVRDEDPDQLVTYANYPTAEYLPLETLDFLMFNIFLERREDFRRYLTRLHHLAGDRPLVLGEVGLDAGEGPDGEDHQAEVLDWQLETAIERGVAGTTVFSWTDEWWVGGSAVEGWSFGLTRADRSPRPALDAVRRRNRRTVRDLDFNWPSISVVICAHNAEATLDECLRHTCELDYPYLEVLVVDDGSKDATTAIVERHPRARLLSIGHSGLAVARNEGYAAAEGDLIAYLDADAYPTPEWPYYLALGLDGSDVGGVGGPNLAPADDPPGAHVVARSPGGPVHVLTSDDRAEHIPGCNMAFWKLVLIEIGGFDPACTSAGDDVDVCWKVLDADWKIGFHPAAFVWHHRRAGLREYLRQQRGYGRSEALIEARHPDRFTPARTARWRGRIYDSYTPQLGSQRIYRGVYGAAAYQSVYHGGGHRLDVMHQAGVPLAAAMLLTAPLALLSSWLVLPALVSLVALLALGTVDMARSSPPRRLAGNRLGFRARVAVHHLLQPLARFWARARHRSTARRGLVPARELPVAVRRLAGGIVVVSEDRPRSELAAGLVETLRHRGFPARQPSGWEDYDARVQLSGLVHGELQTSSHPVGFVQVRIRTRPRAQPLAVILAVVVPATIFINPLLALLLIPAVASLARGAMRARSLPASVLPAPEAT